MPGFLNNAVYQDHYKVQYRKKIKEKKTGHTCNDAIKFKPLNQDDVL
jgi:hypothetical protein